MVQKLILLDFDSGSREAAAEFGHLVADPGEVVGVVGLVGHQADELGDLGHFFFFEAAAGYGRGAQAHAAGVVGGSGVEGDLVGVGHDAGGVQGLGQLAAGEAQGRRP